jgi:transposase
LAPILPVTIEPEIPTPENGVCVTNSQMEIVLAAGDRIIVWSDVEVAALSRVLKALSRR